MAQDRPDNGGGWAPQPQTGERQKCFVGYTESAAWAADLTSACDEVLASPRFNLEPVYASRHFAPGVPLLEKALELITNSRYGIYDLSWWQDKAGGWRLPRNVLIEFGMSMALNRPALLLRHVSNQVIELPECLKSVGGQMLEFGGPITLRNELNDHLQQWLSLTPERDWLKRHCVFGNRVCEFIEAHPRSRQWGRKELSCYISDGPDLDRADFRGVIEEVLERFSGIQYTYLDSLPFTKGYDFLLCSHCQTTRSSSFAIYRITPDTPAEAFIAIGMSIALEKQFEYRIPQLVFTDYLQNLPSLLSGYEVVIAQTHKERKEHLRRFLPVVVQKAREATWKPRELPREFITSREDPPDAEPQSVNQIPFLEQLVDEALGERDYLKAIEALSKIISIDDSNATAYVILAEVLESLGRLEEAEANLKKALALQSDNIEIYILLGRVLTRVGKFDEARTIFQRAIGLDTDNVLPRLGLAELSEKLGILKQADREFREVLRLFPWNDEAHSGLVAFVRRHPDFRTPGKIRLYDLAKELKQDTKRLIEEVRREGVDVSVPSNSISVELANKIRNRYFPKKGSRAPRRVVVVKKARPVPEDIAGGAAPASLPPNRRTRLAGSVSPPSSVITKLQATPDGQDQSTSQSLRVVRLVKRGESEEK